VNAQLEMLLLIPKRPRAPKARAYFDSTFLPRAQLAQAIARAEQQDEQVLAVFRACGRLTPSACQRELESLGVRILLTSVRRSITTLTDAGVLRKTADKLPGPWRMPEFVWQIVGPEARAA
jgi:hypothetical protein